jgi:hypothetical protein
MQKVPRFSYGRSLNIFMLRIGAMLFFFKYHKSLRSWNIFRLGIGASFFNTTYHELLRSLNKFRLRIRGIFLIPRTTNYYVL